MATSSWPLLIVLVVAILLVAVILVAQLTDPDRHRRAEERQILVGDAWRPRNVVRQLPPELSQDDERDSRENVDGGGEPAEPVRTSDDANSRAAGTVNGSTKRGHGVQPSDSRDRDEQRDE